MQQGSDSASKRPKDWRERKAQRQKYWSLSQGFRFGRKLGDWGGPDPRPQPPPSERDAEDADMQEAIRRSLLETRGELHCHLLAIPQPAILNLILAAW